MSLPIGRPHMKLKSMPSPQTGEDDISFRRAQTQFGMYVIRELGLLTNKELASLFKMIRSPDIENLVVTEEIIKNKLDNYKDEE